VTKEMIISEGGNGLVRLFVAINYTDETTQVFRLLGGIGKCKTLKIT